MDGNDKYSDTRFVQCTKVYAMLLIFNPKSINAGHESMFSKYDFRV